MLTLLCQSSAQASIGERVFRRLRKFSRRSLAEMLAESRRGGAGLANTRTAHSATLPWRTLKQVLTQGVRGPDVARYIHLIPFRLEACCEPSFCEESNSFISNGALFQSESQILQERAGWICEQEIPQ